MEEMLVILGEFLILLPHAVSLDIYNDLIFCNRYLNMKNEEAFRKLRQGLRVTPVSVGPSNTSLSDDVPSSV